MTQSPGMNEIARIVREYDDELRTALAHSRSGLFRSSDGQLHVKENVPLGQKYQDEVIGIFADEADLEFFYKLYLDP